jgi:chloride channel protein, CIC family
MGIDRDQVRRVVEKSAQVVVMAGLVGAVTGFGVAAFERIVVNGLLLHIEELPLWMVALAPMVGLLLALGALTFIGGGISSATSDEYLRAFHDPTVPLSMRGLAARMTASITTLGFGGAMGLEGPSLYLGATLGSQAQRLLPRLFRDADRQLLMVAGAAAGVAAIFKAPATGAIFAIEVPYRDDLARRMLLPALVAAATGYLAFVAINGTDRLFPIAGEPNFNFRDMIGALALGVAAGLAARVFAVMVLKAKELSAKPSIWQPLVAGAALAGIFVVGRIATGEDLTLGPGYDTIAWALDPHHGAWLVFLVFVLRCAATTATVGGGGAGGLFIPLVVGGALMGRVVGGAVESLNTTLFVVVGVAAFLGAGYRVPLAAVMFVAETTGRPGFVVPGLLAAVAAELAMGRRSITIYQAADPR